MNVILTKGSNFMNQQLPSEAHGIVIEEKGAKLKTGALKIPFLQDNDLLIKVHAAPINHSDLNELQGKHSLEKKFPNIPGGEGSGTVFLAKGAEAQKYMGKKVVFRVKPDSLIGTYADFSIANANSVAMLNDDTDLNQAALQVSEILNNNTHAIQAQNIQQFLYQDIEKAIKEYEKNSEQKKILIVSKIK
ncbi:GroES (chaperonin 10)-like protein [Pseudocohnilembus persalinus]|uniref:GroES (Chaperonin 10)-like protein n=1 Tax=Pseudocohnilembus persalinus TaxID=266149 RepID=A0A0V0R6E6_PSEPJ|nr:GroES (chaperonin 10)-like protein [Pseudocohnilembus persalinus]|eukprot:KRX10043.1 GroES (chaperonin 10)-like protein [Pseudocohnilembus persalinus]